MSQKPVLLIGGYGVAGRKTARILRERHPDLPLAIAGRDLAKAKAAAAELGGADAYQVDLSAGRPGLGLPHGDFSAMAVLLKDETLDSLVFAGDHGIGYVNVTNGAFESGEEFAYGLRASRRAAVVIASHWFCGAVTLPALKLAETFSRVDRLSAGIVVDRQGSESGPAASADFQRIFAACPSTLQRREGRYEWVSGEAAEGRFEGVGGRVQEATVSVSLDVLSLGAATGARDIRILEIFGESSSRAGGGGPADEITLTLEGLDKSGSPLLVRQDITALRDRTPLTPIYIAMLLEQAVGLAEGGVPAPGLYMPELLLSPTYAVERMKMAGVLFSDTKVEGPREAVAS